MPTNRLSKILEHKKLTDTVFMLRLDAPDIAAAASPGQFVHIRCGDGNLLRRPVSICSADNGVITSVVETRGAGTRWLSTQRAGALLDLMGPLGHGFDVNGNILVVGGGIGVPPLLFAARRAGGTVTAALGFKTSSAVILRDEFESACSAVYVSTDDGTAGRHGFVTDIVKELVAGKSFDTVVACGPKQMLQAVAGMAAEKGVRCQVSLEERMGCGVGACLVCACRTIENGGETMSRVCKDGPVFEATEVVWQ